MSLKIKINNLNKKRRIEPKKIKKACSYLLRSFGKKNVLIDMTFVGDGAIKRLNKKYMRRDRPTDVLSFRLDPAGRAGNGLIGDIYISSDTAYANSRRFGTPYGREIILYAVHGLLHLIGFGDKTKSEKNKIRMLESKFLKILAGGK